MQRRRFTQTAPLGQRLEEQAKRLRQEAKGTPPGIERDRLIRRARQAETASHINQWVSSKGLKALDMSHRCRITARTSLGQTAM